MNTPANAAFWLAAVRENGGQLQHVPEALRTPELCGVALETGGIALEFLPDRLKAEILCASFYA